MGAALLVTLVATGAHGVTYAGGYDKNNVQIRNQPSTTSTLVGRRDIPHQLCLFFATSGEAVGGSTTWWYTRNLSLNRYGYSPGSRVYLTGPVSSC
jgi:hypothetical protein